MAVRSECKILHNKEQDGRFSGLLCRVRQGVKSGGKKADFGTLGRRMGRKIEKAFRFLSRKALILLDIQF
jgi:hypothetical protein